jgi:transmembrane sensor
MEKGYIEALLTSYINREINDADLEELKRLFTSETDKDAIVYTLQALMERHSEGYAFDPVAWEEMRKTILSVDRVDLKQIEQVPIHRSLHRVHFLKTAWFRYAAAVIILFGISAYLWNLNRHAQFDQVAKTNPVAVQNDVPAPSMTRATITLSDGSKVVVDNITNGTLAIEGGASIKKTADGSILYSVDREGAALQYNTLVVPRGSQVASLILSDGTKVFLNAASSLRYPVSFSAGDRRVEISGEAYFEVAKDPTKKFIVSSNGIKTEVLGTHFNISAYAEEQVTAVTLLEGKVKVSNSTTTVTIHPGEQVAAEADGLTKKSGVNVDQVMAWKNGQFLTGQDVEIKAFLRQVSRWYDVDVQYSGTVTGTVGGILSRQVSVSKVLELLESSGSARYKIDGKTVTISPVK